MHVWAGEHAAACKNQLKYQQTWIFFTLQIIHLNNFTFFIFFLRPKGEHSRPSDKTHYVEENPKPIKLAALPTQLFFLALYILGISENNKLCAGAQNLTRAAGKGSTAGVRIGHGAPEKRWGTRAMRRIVWQRFCLPLCRGFNVGVCECATHDCGGPPTWELERLNSFADARQQYVSLRFSEHAIMCEIQLWAFEGIPSSFWPVFM